MQLGKPVTISHQLTRAYSSVGMRSYQSRRFWQPEPFTAEGIIVGKRTLADGTVAYDEDGRHFTAESHFEAYLVAFNMRRAPVLALKEHITPRFQFGEEFGERALFLHSDVGTATDSTTGEEFKLITALPAGGMIVRRPNGKYFSVGWQDVLRLLEHQK